MMALAISSTNMTDVVMAKRNVGLLTDPNGHYPKLFSAAIDASKNWEQVKQLRVVQKVVSDMAAKLSGRDKQIAVHANRFLENRLLAKHPDAIDPVVAEALLQRLAAAIDIHFKDSYLAVLFKNAKKCEVLSQELDL